MKVAIQGQKASFHDEARKKFFSDKVDVVPMESFKDVFFALNEKSVDAAVVAMENSLYGSINEVYDLVLKNKVWIAGEVYLHISHCLIGLKAAKVEDIKEVHSHPVALAQCDEFLENKLSQAERFEHHDTAGSAFDVKEWNDHQKAAIASREAAEEAGLEVLAENIETNPHNYTRFVIVYPARNGITDSDKTSMILHTGHKPGALHRALGAFADNNINLSKLESRPIVGTRWQYMFYVDLEAGENDPRLVRALKVLADNDQKAHLLGSYKRDHLPEIHKT